MKNLGLFMIILGVCMLLLSGALVRPRYLKKNYWKLGRDFKNKKIEKDNKYYVEANFAYLDSLTIKGAVLILLLGIVFFTFSFIF